MILITGANGFIGSYLVKRLAAKMERMVAVVGDHGEKIRDGIPTVHKTAFKNFLQSYQMYSEKALGFNIFEVKTVIHLGACSDTTCDNWGHIYPNNVDYSKMLWNFCTKHGIPMIYASSASVYGEGSSFIESDLAGLPLNKYALSKYIFDLYALNKSECGWSYHPPRWAGLRFFNVYGLPEEHKGSQASMPYKFLVDGKKDGKIGVFDVDCRRDFVHVSNVVDAIEFFIHKGTPQHNGIFNIGTGEAVCVERIARIAASYNNAKVEIVPFPQHLRGKYQCFTKANTHKLSELGLKSFMGIDEGMKLLAEEIK